MALPFRSGSSSDRPGWSNTIAAADLLRLGAGFHATVRPAERWGNPHVPGCPRPEISREVLTLNGLRLVHCRLSCRIVCRRRVQNDLRNIPLFRTTPAADPLPPFASARRPEHFSALLPRCPDWRRISSIRSGTAHRLRRVSRSRFC